MRRFVFIISLILFLTAASNVSAVLVSERRKFYIEPNYDLEGRKELNAILVKSTTKVNFYADEIWWNFVSKNEVHQILNELGDEFESKIYPVLTSVFGPEWNPGIDKDSKITILIHPMKEGAGGYFSAKDEYLKIQIPTSNEREMIYLNANRIQSPLIKALLSHEFVHLITFNQKDNNYNIAEENWLNELRAEYAPTLMGYDDEYQDSYLSGRVKTFLEDQFNPLIEWQDKKEDYGTISLFGHYLVDHYGIKILVDSLQTSKTGIDSINYALAKNGFKQDFSQIFLDWTIAVLINDCTYGAKYCYLNENLKDVFINPRVNFLPLTGESSLTVSDMIKNWSGNWYKIIGGQKDLKFEFISSSAEYFTVPFIVRNRNGAYFVDFIEIENSKKGEAYIKNFGTEITSLYIIAIVNKTNKDSFYPFSWTVSIQDEQGKSGLIVQLLAQIEQLNQQISAVRAQINSILLSKAETPGTGGQNGGQENEGCSTCGNSSRCGKIQNNLFYGLMDNQEVRCLQEFLESQGADIYPQGLVTGNFLFLTKEAVIRFQEKYASEILNLWGLEKGTGYVGSSTKAKINILLGQ